MTSRALGSHRNPSTHLASLSSSVPFTTIDLSGFAVLCCQGQQGISVQLTAACAALESHPAANPSGFADQAAVGILVVPDLWLNWDSLLPPRGLD